MKRMFNLTTLEEDVQRFADVRDLTEYLRGFDGVELLDFGNREGDLIPNDKVVGLHMRCFEFTVDIAKGDAAALMDQFDDWESVRRYYGGTTRQAVVDHYRSDVAIAQRRGAEYLVFHCSESRIDEVLSFRYRNSDAEVIDVLADLLNEVFDGIEDGPALLVENLWHAGFTFTDPVLTSRLIDRIAYKNKGIMLDTGHLLHTDFSLRTQEEGLAYINTQIDKHAHLCQHVRGMHLNQSLTGEVCMRFKNNPPCLKGDFEERYAQVFGQAFAVDRHLPFTCAGVQDLVDRLPLEYLTFEFITQTRQEHEQAIRAQLAALDLP